MGYKVSNNGFNIGDEVILNQDFSSMAGTFEKGTKVTIADCGDRGYAIQDEFGNYMCELGWDIGNKVE